MQTPHTNGARLEGSYNHECHNTITGDKQPSMTQNFTHSDIRTNGGHVASYNHNYAADVIHVLNLGNDCHMIGTNYNAHAPDGCHRLEFQKAEDRYTQHDTEILATQTMPVTSCNPSINHSLIEAISATVLALHASGFLYRCSACIHGGSCNSRTSKGGISSAQHVPETPSLQTMGSGNFGDNHSLIEAIYTILSLHTSGFLYGHGAGSQASLSDRTSVTNTNHPAVDTAATSPGGMPLRQPGNPHATLILHLNNHTSLEDKLGLEAIIEKHIPVPPFPVGGKFSQSKSTLFYYFSTRYADTRLAEVKKIIWSEIYPLLRVPMTDSWRMELLNSWPSIVIHQVRVGGLGQAVPRLLDWRERIQPDLIQHNGVPSLHDDDIKEIRCLSKSGKVPALGTVAIKVSLGHCEDLEQFLDHGAYIFGKRYKTSLYIPRKPRRC